MQSMPYNKKQQLNKHKAVATGLFIAMAILYFGLVYTIQHTPQNWMYYVKAFAEAGMVGALADWFAVTALFKYPMGLKIPHTNLIENSKNAIGENLGTFVTENFLTPETIRPYIERIEASVFLIQWIKKEKSRILIINELRKFLGKIVKNLNDDEIAKLLSTKGYDLLNEIKVEQWAAKGLLYVVENDEHNELITLLMPKAKMYVEQNRETIYKKVVEKQPLLGLIGGKSVTNQLISGITAFLSDIEHNKEHEIRKELTLKLLQLANDFTTDEEWQHKFSEIKDEFISYEKIQHYAHEIWLKMKEETLTGLAEEKSLISTYITNNINALADNLETNEDIQQKINSFVRQFVYKLALKNSNEIGTIITTTVADWDGRELSEKLELEVGKDLQYIRVNGTLVGGIVGLLIFIVTQWIT